MTRKTKVPIGTGAWDAARRDSYARVWRVLDLHPDRIRWEGAILATDRFVALIAAVDHDYDVKLPA